MLNLRFHPVAFALVTPWLDRAEFSRLDLLYGPHPMKPEFAIFVSDQPSDREIAKIANQRAAAGLMRIEQRLAEAAA